MNTFNEWVDFVEESRILDWLLEFEEYDLIERSSPWTYEDVPSMTKTAIQYLLLYASKPTLKDGRPNWMHNNYIYWAKNTQLLEKLILDRFANPGKLRKARPTPETSNSSGLKIILKQIGASIMQGSHGGGGSRRDHVYAVNKGVQTPHIALDADYPDATAMPGKNIYKNPNAWHDISSRIRNTTLTINSSNFSKMPKKTQKLWQMYRDYLINFKDEFKKNNKPIPEFSDWVNHTNSLHS